MSNGTFDGLKTITILSLGKNFIEELGASVFTDLVRVEELDLGQAGLNSPSKIKLDEQKLFSACPRSNLINKNFFQNRIRTVDQGTFSGLQHLRVLYLDDNDLAEVELPN